MSAQLAFSLPHRPVLGRDDFLVSPANEEAVGWIDRWPDWPGGILALAGPAACGKSHLIEVWRARSDAPLLAPSALDAWMDWSGSAAIDGLDEGFSEEALFHAVNWVRAKGLTLLLAARRPPATWPITLPDLRSRLATIPVAAIAAPDDALIDALIVKQFADRQLAVTPETVHFLRLRIDRSFEAVNRVIERLDARALAEKRALTLPFIRRVLEDEEKN
jgi:chromosomal replication initiation ATPase DnaA